MKCITRVTVLILIFIIVLRPSRTLVFQSVFVEGLRPAVVDHAELSVELLYSRGWVLSLHSKGLNDGRKTHTIMPFGMFFLFGMIILSLRNDNRAAMIQLTLFHGVLLIALILFSAIGIYSHYIFLLLCDGLSRFGNPIGTMMITLRALNKDERRIEKTPGSIGFLGTKGTKS